ncbi:MAG: LacI family transcriptional regulator [Ruminococcaceae bacterium]|nr:LacI family transcriptional regulator [Oscillospiraceae bacterium]
MQEILLDFTQILCYIISNNIAWREFMSKKVTSTDVARLAGVSQTTVSFVLSGKESASISAETKARVLKAAAELGYKHPQRQKRKTPLTLGLMVPTLSNLYYPFLLQKMELEARARGIHVIIMDVQRSAESEAFYFDFIRRGIVDGIIVLFTPQTKIPPENPVLVISEYEEGLLTDTISLNSYRAGYILAEHLVQQGHRDFAYISTPLQNTTNARKYRLDGVRDCLRDAGIASPITVLMGTGESEHLDSSYEYDCGYALTNKLLSSGCTATAIIAVNDTTAAGCLAALRQAGKRVPEDIAVAGFDNLLLGRILQPELTSVDQMAGHAGCLALDILLRRLQDPDAGELAVQMQYQPHLIVRQSTMYSRSAIKTTSETGGLHKP